MVDLLHVKSLFEIKTALLLMNSPSAAGLMSEIWRWGFGIGAGHTFLPKAGTSGRVNTIS